MQRFNYIPKNNIRIEIIDYGDDLQKILKILEKTEDIILEHISEISLFHEDYIPDCYLSKENKNKNVLGVTHKKEGNILQKIGIVSSKSEAYKEKGNSFERTLYHEIGHVKGYILNIDSEPFAITYANLCIIKEFILNKIQNL